MKERLTWGRAIGKVERMILWWYDKCSFEDQNSTCVGGGRRKNKKVDRVAHIILMGPQNRDWSYSIAFIKKYGYDTDSKADTLNVRWKG